MAKTKWIAGAIKRPEDLAYLAGFFDGEGSVCIYPEKRARRGSWRMTIEVRNTDEPSVRLFHLAFGGSVKAVKSRNPKWKDAWTWQADGRVGEAALRVLLPYLKLKRERVIVALTYRDTVRVGRPYYTTEEREVQTGLVRQFKLLNLRGRAVNG